MWQFHGGVHPKDHKNLSSTSSIAPADIPPFLVLPLLQHIGEPTEPVVNIGDKVLKGQIIAHCHAYNCRKLMTVPLHSSSSGTVVAIEERTVPHPSGLTAPCIIIETDGKDTWAKQVPLTDYSDLSSNMVRDYIARAGIVGLGGAGFPAHIKLRPDDIDTLIINGSECEPYITCDDRLMQEQPHEIIAGAKIIKHALGGIKRCIIAVEDNKPAAYKALSEAADEQTKVVKIPTVYPTGGEKQLIYVLTGHKIKRGQLPAKFGIVVHNVETARAVYRAVQLGRPLVSRVITVTGGAVDNPQNLEVRLGTPMRFLVDQCGRKPEMERLIMGGAMMGFAQPDDDMPVVKTTNCLIASLGDRIKDKPVQMPCIRCGACMNTCPLNLLPQQLYWYAKAKDLKKIQDYNLFECIECGCCSYVCPSHIPLVSYYRYAKAEIRKGENEQKKAESAKQRHEFRIFRLQREKEERKAKHKKAATDKSKQDKIKAALARVKEKKGS
ncbi:electron transport complex subunit RsxC [Candidatus Halobeggiatoa sp. HSG11]|nr:electron transport complex subunit RsxC [Candidatus Halobeggiatoa sp. HSG11]